MDTKKEETQEVGDSQSIPSIDKSRIDYFLKGTNDVYKERLRQIEIGYGTDNDDSYIGGELAAAGGCYAFHAAVVLHEGTPPSYGDNPPGWWPFNASSWKPETARENLIKAAALIIAEIDKIDRKEAEALTMNKGDRPDLHPK